MKSVLLGFGESFRFFRQPESAPVAPSHPHSSMRVFCSLCASCVFSFQAVLPPDYRPLIHLCDGLNYVLLPSSLRASLNTTPQPAPVQPSPPPPEVVP